MDLIDSALSRKTILNTRDSERASEVSSTIRRYGADVKNMPMLQFRSLLDNQVRERLLSVLNRPSILLLSSAMAVKELEKGGIIQFLTQGNNKIFVVGPETKRAALQVGLSVQLTVDSIADFDAVGLADQVLGYLKDSHFLSKPSGPIVYCGAKDHEASGLKKLRDCGFGVDEFAIYRSEKPDYTTSQLVKLRSWIENNLLDAILIFSALGADNFVELIGSLLSDVRQLRRSIFHIPIIAIGPKTAQKIKQLGFLEVRAPIKPSIQMMVDTLIGVFS